MCILDVKNVDGNLAVTYFSCKTIVSNYNLSNLQECHSYFIDGFSWKIKINKPIKLTQQCVGVSCNKMFYNYCR